jgi:hypothetical protein
MAITSLLVSVSAVDFVAELLSAVQAANKLVINAPVISVVALFIIFPLLNCATLPIGFVHIKLTL